MNMAITVTSKDAKLKDNAELELSVEAGDLNGYRADPKTVNLLMSRSQACKLVKFLTEEVLTKLPKTEWQLFVARQAALAEKIDKQFRNL